jgi:hypothetical protein
VATPNNLVDKSIQGRCRLVCRRYSVRKERVCMVPRQERGRSVELFAQKFRNDKSLISRYRRRFRIQIWFLTYNRYRTTRSIRIASVGFFATTNGNVIRNPTVGIETTCSHAWINATILKTVLVTRAVCVENTFWSTRNVRVAYITRRTHAIDGSILRFALGVCTTRIRVARSWWLDDIWFNYFEN